MTINSLIDLSMFRGVGNNRLFCSLDSPTGDAVPTAGFANANGRLGNTIDNLGTETGSRAGIFQVGRAIRARSTIPT